MLKTAIKHRGIREGMGKEEENYLTPGRVAKQLMVSPAAVRLWAKTGELKALVTPGGHRRFFQSDVDQFAAQRGLVINGIPREKLSVLIVDDDIQFSRYLMKLLKKYTASVHAEVANDGFEAGVKVSEMKPDVVLLDLMMPGLDGFEVCKRLKSSAATSNVRVIGMTGYPSNENVEKIIAAGAEACLPKPVERKDLLGLLGLEQLGGNVREVS